MNAEGVVDATACECENGWEFKQDVDSPGETFRRRCKDPDDWGTWDPVTKLPRISCLDTVSRADYARYRDPESRKEFIAPTNRFYGSTIFAPTGPEIAPESMSYRGYLDKQEHDALCKYNSGLWKSSDPEVAGKREGCPDPCAYTCCNCGRSYTVQCPDHCFTAAGVVYGSPESDGVKGPYQDISSICRAAILSGVGVNHAPFYVTFTIVEPLSAYQDPGGGRVVFDRWDRATDPTYTKYVSDKCCQGGWPPKLGLEHNAILKYRAMYHDEWENIRAFTVQKVEDTLCPKGKQLMIEHEVGCMAAVSSNLFVNHIIIIIDLHSTHMQ